MWPSWCTDGQEAREKMLTITICCCYLVTKSCLTLCDAMDCSPSGAFVLGISQARMLEWVASSFSRGSSLPRDQTRVFCIGRWILCPWATREAIQIQTIMKYHLTLVRMAIIKKNLQTINAGEGVEKRETSYTVGWNENRYSHYGGSYGSSLKNRK